MAGTFVAGESKVRPGAYFNITKRGEGNLAGASDGVVSVLFQSDFGPLCKAIEIPVEDGYESIFGTGGTTDALREAIAGGAIRLIACRIGNGGTKASIKLKSGETDAVTISASYVGDMKFSITVRNKLTDSSKKECIIYSATREFEKFVFEAGENEPALLAKAFENSVNFSAEAAEGATGALDNVSQSIFAAGSNPQVTIEDYSNGLTAIEMFDCNTLCVDTTDSDVLALVTSYVNRIFDAGQMLQLAIGADSSLDFDGKLAVAKGYNSEKIVYVVNPGVKRGTAVLTGYQTAARIAGMIASNPSNQSLTHMVIDGFTELVDKLTPSQMVLAEQSGCLVLSTNTNRQVWIDNAINTLVTPGENQDDGWKKIRRVKTRQELLKRVNNQTDALVGKVDNDINGRAAIVGQIQAIGNAMIQEGKLLQCNVVENAQYQADGDACWFDIDVVDKDSAEHIYLTYKFRFSTILDAE